MTNILASIATMPHRESILKKMLPLVCDNVSRVNLHLNGFKDIPEYLHEYPKVVPFLYPENQGSIVRFRHLSKEYDYTYFLDDDILPTQGFFDVSLEAASRFYNGVVTFYGYTWDPSKGFNLTTHGVNKVKETDIQVMGFGAGVSCIRPEFLPTEADVVNNMNDLSLGLFYAKKGVRMLIPKHDKGLMECISAERVLPRTRTTSEVVKARRWRRTAQVDFVTKHKDIFQNLWDSLPK